MCIRDREYLIVHPQHGSKEPAEARRSLELFAKEVLPAVHAMACLLYTSDAADERSSVDLGGRRIIKKKNTEDRNGAQQD